MSLKRHVCRLGHNAKVSPDHIWIGNDIFDTAVRRFRRLASARRSVSFLPGPLEARKRATKRRLAHMSQAGGSGPEKIDPSLLAGVNERARNGQWQWQAPSASTLDQPDLLSLPKWLTDVIHHPKASPVTAEQTGTQETQSIIGSNQSKDEPRLQTFAFLRRLKECDNVDQLHALADFYDIDVRNYSQRAFRHLYKHQRSLQTCLDFLGDRSLDGPEAQNLKYLLGQLKREMIHPSDAEAEDVTQLLRAMLVPWAKIELTLGRRREEDIADLLAFVLISPQTEVYKTFRKDLTAAILGGLRSSTVLGYRDLTPEIQKSMLQSLTKNRLTYELQELGLDLIEALEQPLTIDLRGIVSRFLANCVKSMSAWHDAGEVQAWQQNMFPRISSFLRRLPEGIRCHLVRSASRHLVIWQSSLPSNSRICAGLMDQWWSSIAKPTIPNFLTHGIGSLQIEDSMPADRLDALASYASHLGDRKKARFVYRNWFAKSMANSDFEVLSKQLIRNLERDGGKSPFICMLRTVRSSLPNDAAWKNFILHTFHLLGRVRMHQVLVEIFAKSKESGLDIPADVAHTTIRMLLSVSVEQAHRIFSLDSRLALEEHPQLAIKLIKRPSIHPDTVWHSRGKSSSRLGTRTEQQSNAKARAQLLDMMATTFSTARHITSRMARRHVMKCIRSYKSENLGLLSLSISRALTRTGIIRPLQESRNVSTVLLTYILGIVREVEGADRADAVDRIFHAWRQQVSNHNKPKWDLEQRMFEQEGPLKFVVKRVWSNSHRRYDRVMLPIREAGREGGIDNARINVD